MYNDRLAFSFEAFDFDAETNPHLKFRADYTPFQHIYLTTGFDDFISEEGNESFFIGAGIQFSDEDIKTLLFNVPIPKS
jgi:phospholipid/cholesterol/gamma-HCH transport system substrate-binding protein